MTALRSLLRLDEKVAAETRRIEGLGASKTPWALPAAIVLAVGVHAAALWIPLPHVGDAGEAVSRRPDLPPVWRWTEATGGDAAGTPAPPSGNAERPRSAPAQTGGRPRAGLAEIDPVPEPAPDLGDTGIPAEIEALIPPPDPLPSGGDAREGSRAAVALGEVPTGLAPVERVNPTFPALARSVRAAGTVSLIASIGTDGRVEDVRLVSCTRPGVGFEAAAVEAVRRWKYPPAAGGSPVREAAVRIDFRREGIPR